MSEPASAPNSAPQQSLPGSQALDSEELLKKGQIMQDMESLRRAQASVGSVLVFPFIFFCLVVGHYLGLVNKTFMILCGAMSFSGMLIHMATKEYPTRDGASKSTILERLLAAATGTPIEDENQSMSDLVTKFRLETNNIQQSHLLLLNIRKTLTTKGPAAVEAVKLGLIKFALLFAQEKSTMDKRIPAALDVITVLLSRPEACKLICDDDASLKDAIDMLLQSVKEHMKTDAELDAVIAAESGAQGDKANASTESVSGSGSNASSIDFDFSDHSEHAVPIPNKYFLKFGHKFIMALGMLGADHVVAQTRLGDRGAVALLVRCLQACKSSGQMAKWCLWSLIHITFNHPPNKREFFIQGGLAHTMAALKQHPQQLDLHQQGLALIATIIATDSNTKMNLSKARETCLANGVFEMLQSAKKEFPDQKEVQAMIKQIFDALMADWS